MRSSIHVMMLMALTGCGHTSYSYTQSTPIAALPVRSGVISRGRSSTGTLIIAVPVITEERKTVGIRSMSEIRVELEIPNSEPTKPSGFTVGLRQRW